MQYVAIDIETTGLSKNCQVLEVACVFENTETSEIPVEKLPFFEVLFRRYPSAADEPYAMEMHRESGLLGACQARGLYQVDAWNLVRDRLQKHSSKKMVAAGSNVGGFDLQFFPLDIQAMFHHQSIETSSVFIDWAEDKPPSLRTLKSNFDIPDVVIHRALADARDVVRVLRMGY